MKTTTTPKPRPTTRAALLRENQQLHAALVEADRRVRDLEAQRRAETDQVRTIGKQRDNESTAAIRYRTLINGVINALTLATTGANQELGDIDRARSGGVVDILNADRRRA